MKPKIALLMRINEQKYTVNQDYVNALLNSNAEVIILLPQSKESLAKELSRCNGLIIPGGEDVNPKMYKQENIYSHIIDESIEQLDLDSIEIMHKLNKPIFGICRGLQILNVAFGGTLVQDINKQLHDKSNHNYSHLNNMPLNGHKIHIQDETRLAKILKTDIEVNSYHHQCIDTLAPIFNISAYSEDGLIEAIETENILAVQWHPERMCSINEFQELFNYFVESCRN